MSRRVDRADGLAPVLAALEQAARGVSAATVGGVVPAPRITLDEARRGRARGRFLAGAWADGHAEVVVPRRVLRSASACVGELLHQLAHAACAVATEADLAALPVDATLKDVHACAECGGYHKRLWSAFLKARHQWRPATESAGHQGFVHVRPPRTAGPVISALKKKLAAALTVHAAALPGRSRPGRNYAKFVCGCDPRRIGRFPGARSDALCVRCRQPFEPAA